MNYPHYGSEWQSPTGDGSGGSAAWTDRAAPSGAATAGDWVPPPSRNGHITVFSGGSAFNPGMHSPIGTMSLTLCVACITLCVPETRGIG